MDEKKLREEILKDPLLQKMAVFAKAKDVRIFLVGGYIRDLLIGRKKGDYDFTFPKEISSKISAVEEALGLRFFRIGREETGTVTYRVIKRDISIDLTPFQGETIQDDLRRRDFTINAIAFSLQDGTFHSVEGAWDDVKNRIIRAVSNQSIDDDPLRSLRAVRYLSILRGFTIDPELEEEIASKKGLVRKTPGERIKAEFDQILLSPRPEAGARSLHQLGLLGVLIPELEGLREIDQNGYHHLNVLSHTLLMIEKISWAFHWLEGRGHRVSLSEEELLSLYYAALFHDIGKTNTYTEDDRGRIHFYHHEDFSCRAAEGIMKRLRFPNSMKERVLGVIKNHMRINNLLPDTKETALKRLVNRIGDQTPLLVLHTLADKEASRGDLSIKKDEVVERHCLRILDLFNEKEIVHPPQLITGYDVMALGYSAGPAVAEILNFIHGKQVEGEIRTREEALEMLKKFFRLEVEI